MARLDTRVSALEQASKEHEQIRPLTDADRAVRLMRILNGPDTPMRKEVIEFLQRTENGPK